MMIYPVQPATTEKQQRKYLTPKIFLCGKYNQYNVILAIVPEDTLVSSWDDSF